jgi:hypothetical protein
MTNDQAVDIGVRLETAIMGLKAALLLARESEHGPELTIEIALEYAGDALEMCKKEARP